MDDIYEYNGEQFTYTDLQTKYGKRTDDAIKKFGFKKIAPLKTTSEEKQYTYNDKVFTSGDLRAKYGDRVEDAITKFGFKEVNKKEQPNPNSDIDSSLESALSDVSEDQNNTILQQQSIQRVDPRPKTIDKEELFKQHHTNEKVQEVTQQKKEQWRDLRSEKVTTLKKNIEEVASTLTLDELVQGNAVVSEAEEKEIDHLTQMIEGKWYTANKGANENKKLVSQAREQRFKGILENDLQPDYTIGNKAKEIIKENPEVTPDFAEQKVKNKRLQEAVELLPSNRSKRLYQQGVRVAELKKK